MAGLGAIQWVNTFLETHWDAMAERVGAKRMPLVRFHEPNRDPRWGRLGEESVVEHMFPELGCGAYGCVVPTATAGLVLKLTRDEREAFFAAQAMRMGGWPSGITRYHAAYSVATDIGMPSNYDGDMFSDNLYLLWREAVTDPGAMQRDLDDYNYRIPGRGMTQAFWLATYVGAHRSAAQRVFWEYRKHLEHPEVWFELLGEAATLDVLQSCAPDEFASMHYDKRKDCFSHTPSVALAQALDMCSALTEEMRFYGGTSLAATFDTYRRRGLLICDAHTGNIGRVLRRTSWEAAQPLWAIFDPGQVVPLRPETAYAEIEEL